MESASHIPEVAPERRISRANLERLLRDMEARDVINGITIYARAGQLQECLHAPRGRNGGGLEELMQLAPRAEKSETGAVVFWSDGFALEGSSPKGSRLIILPPFPVERDELLEGWDVSQLRTLLAREYVLGVVLLRLGRFAVGVFRGEALVSSKTDTRYVKGKHSAGGRSQKRFQRIREKQVQEIFDKTCSVVREHFTPFEDQLDYIFLGGERFTLQGFLKRCDYLQRLTPKILSRVLNVREPKHQALQGVIETIWESRMLSI